MHRWILALLIGALMGACAPTEAPKENSPSSTSETQPKAEQAATEDNDVLESNEAQGGLSPNVLRSLDSLRNDEALVQILMVGISVFERKPNGLAVYMPKITGHTIQLDQGKQGSNGKPTWDKVAVVSTGTTWTLDIGSTPKDFFAPPTLVDRDQAPNTEAEARDSRWLLTGKEIGGGTPQTLRPGSARLTLSFDSGVFETCGLVADGNDAPCRVLFGDIDRPVIAESMVLRQVIKKSQTVKIGTHTILPNNGASVTLDGNTYNTVYDIAIVNVPEESQRTMWTDHTMHLKQMFQNPIGNWSRAIGYECHASIPQPDCYRYFARFEKRYSGYNRPICPLIEGP